MLKTIDFRLKKLLLGITATIRSINFYRASNSSL